jgi:hypothetical protein
MFSYIATSNSSHSWPPGAELVFVVNEQDTAYISGSRVRAVGDSQASATVYLTYIEGTLVKDDTTWTVTIDELFRDNQETITTYDDWRFSIAGSRPTTTSSQLILNSTVTSVGTLSGALVVNGGVGIGKNVFVGFLQGAGNRAVYSTTDGELTNSASDERLKKNVTAFDMGLTATIALNPIYYNWTNEGIMGEQREVGFIAQQVQEILPEAVGTNADGHLSLDYPRIIPMLVNSIKELKQQIDDLTRRVQDLEG